MVQEADSQFHWHTVRDVNVVCNGDPKVWKDEYRMLFATDPPERLYTINTKDLFMLLRMLIRRQKHWGMESDGD